MQTETFQSSGDHVSSGQCGPDIHTSRSRADVIAQIRELYRSRTEIIKGELALQHRMRCVALRILGIPPSAGAHQKAAKLVSRYQKFARGKDLTPDEDVLLMHGTSVPIFAEALKPIRAARAKLEKQLGELAQELPVWTEYCQHFKGMGALMVASLVGEAGALGKYRHWRCLWKRLGVAVIRGERQRKIAGNKELAKEHGYAPARRSTLWLVGIMCIRNNRMRIYRDIYEEVKTSILERENDREEWPLARCDAHAMRLASKQFVKDLWLVWRDLERGVPVATDKRPTFRSD